MACWRPFHSTPVCDRPSKLICSIRHSIRPRRSLNYSAIRYLLWLLIRDFNAQKADIIPGTWYTSPASRATHGRRLLRFAIPSLNSDTRIPRPVESAMRCSCTVPRISSSRRGLLMSGQSDRWSSISCRQKCIPIPRMVTLSLGGGWLPRMLEYRYVQSILAKCLIADLSLDRWPNFSPSVLSRAQVELEILRREIFGLSQHRTRINIHSRQTSSLVLAVCLTIKDKDKAAPKRSAAGPRDHTDDEAGVATRFF
ncbi:hypothetical protein C8F04DRAFT_145926 [Mycena alexandri]|uniref:Uncharacterized protein n=1 Tax=Mycena alexandri TaxID=1745969 RepID=A0AAD6T913_9AGAR|nr:hypothetical protein C8F04DRAFT_145926 [Mycena alexandri]